MVFDQDCSNPDTVTREMPVDEGKLSLLFA
jgi:hypothetical protein